MRNFRSDPAPPARRSDDLSAAHHHPSTNEGRNWQPLEPHTVVDQGSSSSLRLKLGRIVHGLRGKIHEHQVGIRARPQTSLLRPQSEQPRGVLSRQLHELGQCQPAARHPSPVGSRAPRWEHRLRGRPVRSSRTKLRRSEPAVGPRAMQAPLVRAPAHSFAQPGWSPLLRHRRSERDRTAKPLTKGFLQLRCRPQGPVTPVDHEIRGVLHDLGDLPVAFLDWRNRYAIRGAIGIVGFDRRP